MKTGKQKLPIYRSIRSGSSWRRIHDSAESGTDMGRVPERIRHAPHMRNPNLPTVADWGLSKVT